MAVNTNRSIWGIHGIPAILVGFVVLVIITVILQLLIVMTYRDGAAAPYDEAPLRDINNVKRIAPMEEQRAFAFQDPKSEKK